MMTATEDITWLRLKAAEKLGWREVEYSRNGCLVGHAPGRKDIKLVPSYASDIKAAWEIVQALFLQGAQVRVENVMPGARQCIVEIHWPGSPVYRAIHPLPSTAICLAFLECKVA
jgi:hypothetical protein